MRVGRDSGYKRLTKHLSRSSNVNVNVNININVEKAKCNRWTDGPMDIADIAGYRFAFISDWNITNMYSRCHLDLEIWGPSYPKYHLFK